MESPYGHIDDHDGVEAGQSDIPMANAGPFDINSNNPSHMLPPWPPNPSAMTGLSLSDSTYSRQDEEDDELDSIPEDSGAEPSHEFFRSLLETCAQGFNSINSCCQTSEVRRAVMACQLGLDYINTLNDETDEAAMERARVLSSAVIGTRASTNRSYVQKQPSLSRLPAEILLRIFNFVCILGGVSGFLAPKSARTLHACALVARHWTQPANTVLWKRIHMAGQPARFGKFVLGSATSKYNKRESSALVRVMSVACTDADLSLLSVACHHTPELHSLELLRAREADTQSYRLLQRLPHRFSSLRSLVADTFEPSSWRDLFRLCQTCPLLSNLHISFAFDANYDTTDLPQVPDYEALLSCIPFLKSLSLWRVPLPADEEGFGYALASNCQNLRAIRIDDCGSTLSMGLVMDIWNRCRQLQSISLRMIRQPPRHGWPQLETLPTMRSFLIDGCWLTDDMIMSIARAAPNLETFYVENDWRDGSDSVGSVVQLTDRGIFGLAPHFRNLRTLSLVGLMGEPHLSSKSVKALLSYNRGLTSVNLARPHHANAFLEDAALVDLAPNFMSIRRLELYMQTHISEEALAETLSDAYRLISFGMSGCVQLTDKTVAALPHLCPMLERLDIAGLTLTPPGLQALLDGAPRLSEVVVDPLVGSQVHWGRVMQFDDPWSEDVFSPYSVWEREVRRVAGVAGFVY
ncbi:hypothetical protein DFS34DRAFT_131634 [Phlyctochytrium arcticum]|nr:hypothetical protein DFS34DRAFT_131634 [Phlyctochytrium arcticum]